MRSMRMRIAINKEDSFAERVVVLIIVLSPILQHYKGFFVYSGLLSLLLALPYTVIKLFEVRKLTSNSLVIVAPLVPYFIFQVLDHGTSASEMSHVFLFLLYAIAFSSEALSSKLFVRFATGVACIASVLIIIQHICYYFMGFHLQLVPTSLLLSNAKQWIQLAQTGKIGITGRTGNLYRPSAFFLEPAHMFVYLFPPLLYELLHPNFGNRERKKAVLISIGLIMSTSGMGLVVTAAAWVLHFAKRGGKDSRLSLIKLLRPRNLAVMACIVALISFLFFRIEFFQDSLLRILSSTERESVISGRTSLGTAYISRLKGSQFLFGISDSYADEIQFHMSGFNGSMYRYGIIGTILSYLFYVKCLFDLREQQFWISVVIIIISFFSAHTHAVFYMLYFVIFLIDGYCNRYKIEKQQEGGHVPEYHALAFPFALK